MQPSAAPPAPASPRPLARWVYVLFGVAIAGVITGGFLFYAYEPGSPLNPISHPRVAVTEVVWTGRYIESSPGFNVEAGAPEWVSASLYCPNGTNVFYRPVAENCTSGSVFIETSGFGLISTNAPVTWSSGLTGASMTVSVDVLAPSQAYSGNLTIDLH